MDLDELSCIGKGGASSLVTPSSFDKASSALKSNSARHHLRTGCVPSRKAIYEGTLGKKDAEVKSRKAVEKLACGRRRNQGCVLFQRDQCGQVIPLKFGIAHAPRTLQAVALQAAATFRDGERVLVNRIELAVLTPMMATLQELCRKDLYSTPRATPEMLFWCACELKAAIWGRNGSLHERRVPGQSVLRGASSGVRFRLRQLQSKSATPRHAAVLVNNADVQFRAGREHGWRTNLKQLPRETKWQAATASVCSKTVVMTLNATHRRQEAPTAYNGSQ